MGGVPQPWVRVRVRVTRTDGTGYNRCVSTSTQLRDRKIISPSNTFALHQPAIYTGGPIQPSTGRQHTPKRRDFSGRQYTPNRLDCSGRQLTPNRLDFSGRQRSPKGLDCSARLQDVFPPPLFRKRKSPPVDTVGRRCYVTIFHTSARSAHRSSELRGARFRGDQYL